MAHTTNSIAILTFILMLWSCVSANNTSTTGDFITGNFSNAAVASNVAPCGEIAKNILSKGGKAVDAAIALLICEGVVHPHISGIGGGFSMTIYERSGRRAYTIIAREKAPEKSLGNMFWDNPDAAKKGVLSIAIPGEVRGYWMAFKRFGGGVSWNDLFEPSIKLCEKGIPVGMPLLKAIHERKEMFALNDNFNYIFLNMESGTELKYGDKFLNLRLAQTLRTIAQEGGDAFYEGPLAQRIVTSIRLQGGLITEDDFKNYEPRLVHPVETTIFKNFTIRTLFLPSSGPILTYVLKLVDGLLPTHDDLRDTRRITEALKYAFAARSKLGDPQFVDNSEILNRITSEEKLQNTRNNIGDSTWNDPKHYGGIISRPRGHGTANIAVVSQNGDAVVATSSLNQHFGSEILSSTTGIIFNNQMYDFSQPDNFNLYGLEPSTANYIEPGKMPMSSHTPAVITDENGDVRLAIGAAGGPRTISGVAIATIRSILFREDIETAVRNIFFHHQLIPMKWMYYKGVEFPQYILDGMKMIGHDTRRVSRKYFPAITAIERKNGQLHSISDFRSGQVAGY